MVTKLSNKKVEYNQDVQNTLKSLRDLVSMSGSQAGVISLSIAQLNELRKAGLCDSSVAYQRSLKASWLDPVYRGRVLDSILRGWSIGMIYVILRDDGSLEFMDGKQRLNFVGTTLDATIAFSGVEVDSCNRVFSEWAQKDKDTFMNFKIPFCVFPPVLDEEDRREVFERLNSGVVLSALDKRRGLILDVVTNKAVTGAVDLVHRLMISAYGTGKKPPCKDSAEEVILQALSFHACNNQDFTATGANKDGGYVYTLKSAQKDSITSGIGKIAKNLAIIGDYWRGFNEEDQKDSRWLFKKSTLNTLLCVDFGDSMNTGFASFQKDAGDKEAGEDQKLYKSLVSSATGSASSVSGRIAILQKIQDGQATKNIIKDSAPLPKKDGVKNPKPKKSTVVKDSGKVEVIPYVEAWGSFATEELTQRLTNVINQKYPNRGKIEPKVTQNGKKYVRVFDNTDGKNHPEDVEVLLGIKK